MLETMEPSLLPLVSSYLQQNSLKSLATTYGIKVKRHKRFPELIMLKYDMIESPMADPLVQQCRGLILNEKENYRVVAWPFDKFFNAGEGHAATIDWETAIVQEKLDGSLMILYWYNGEWHVASSGLPDASGNLGNLLGEDVPPDFATLFWQTWKQHGFELPPEEMKDTCFIWELCTPYNKVIVSHPQSKLTLLGVRKTDGTEIQPHQFGYPTVRTWALQSLQDIMKTFQDMDPLRQEGYVVVDRHFRRIKVKHPGYVALAHVKGAGWLSTEKAITVVTSGEIDEVCAAFPEWETKLRWLQTQLHDLILELEEEYLRISGITLQKDFALEAVKTPLPAVLFSVRSGKMPSIGAAVRATKPEVLVRYVLSSSAPLLNNYNRKE